MVKHGDRFSNLTVVTEMGTDRTRHMRYLCLCDCGSFAIVRGSDLTNGHTTSCGCIRRNLLRKSATKHGLRHDPLYSRWSGIKMRCYNTKHQSYPFYGGRGIRMCDDWKDDFNSFYEWSIQNGYSNDLELDRIDPNGDYKPSNCRWIPKDINALNKRTTVMVNWLGIQIPLLTACEWCGLNYDRALRYKVLQEFPMIYRRVCNGC